MPRSPTVVAMVESVLRAVVTAAPDVLGLLGELVGGPQSVMSLVMKFAQPAPRNTTT